MKCNFPLLHFLKFLRTNPFITHNVDAISVNGFWPAAATETKHNNKAKYFNLLDVALLCYLKLVPLIFQYLNIRLWLNVVDELRYWECTSGSHIQRSQLLFMSSIECVMCVPFQCLTHTNHHKYCNIEIQ